MNEVDIIDNLNRIMFLFGMYADAGDFYAQRYGSPDTFEHDYPDTDCNTDADPCDNNDSDPNTGTGTTTDRRGTDVDTDTGNHTDRQPRHLSV